MAILATVFLSLSQQNICDLLQSGLTFFETNCFIICYLLQSFSSFCLNKDCLYVLLIVFYCQCVLSLNVAYVVKQAALASVIPICFKHKLVCIGKTSFCQYDCSYTGCSFWELVFKMTFSTSRVNTPTSAKFCTTSMV